MLKGNRCLTPACAMDRRAKPPGQQISRRRRFSDRGLQLREKQKARYTYGVLERQFRRFFAQAEKQSGITGENLLVLLERRLDNVVCRLGFADSRSQARQLVRHGHFTLNGRKTDIPSCLVKPGDVITWKENKVKLFPYQYAAQNIASKQIPGWLNVDTDTLTAKVLAQPTREDIGGTINERLIVEYYSK